MLTIDKYGKYTKYSKYIFATLFLFTLGFSNALWGSTIGISIFIDKYYQTDPSTIKGSLVDDIFYISYLLFSPFSFYFSLLPAISISLVFTFIGSVIRMFYYIPITDVGNNNSSYSALVANIKKAISGIDSVIIGNALISGAQPFAFNYITNVSEAYVSKENRGLYIGATSMFSSAGYAMGYLISIYVIKSADDYYKQFGDMNYIYAVFSFLLIVALLIYFYLRRRGMRSESVCRNNRKINRKINDRNISDGNNSDGKNRGKRKDRNKNKISEINMQSIDKNRGRKKRESRKKSAKGKSIKIDSHKPGKSKDNNSNIERKSRNSDRKNAGKRGVDGRNSNGRNSNEKSNNGRNIKVKIYSNKKDAGKIKANTTNTANTNDNDGKNGNNYNKKLIIFSIIIYSIISSIANVFSTYQENILYIKGMNSDDVFTISLLNLVPPIPFPIIVGRLMDKTQAWVKIVGTIIFIEVLTQVTFLYTTSKPLIYFLLTVNGISATCLTSTFLTLISELCFPNPDKYWNNIAFSLSTLVSVIIMLIPNVSTNDYSVLFAMSTFMLILSVVAYFLVFRISSKHIVFLRANTSS